MYRNVRWDPVAPPPVNDIQVIGEAGTTQQAMQITANTRPDVVLMDLDLPGGGAKPPRPPSSPTGPTSRSWC
jgi:hypothetical protein